MNIKKYISVKEFQEKGYLQEVNRQFLHQLGLALEIVYDNDTGEYYIGGIQDHRETGISFGLEDTNPERIDRFIKNNRYIEEQKQIQNEIRGFENNIEKIPSNEKS